uniref:glycosyltransferase n=1 Tax=Halomonas sp. TaxID=1486246 RepID=UPI002627E86B|nr:glycosyltransferase [Halomonas sp.]
MDDVTVKSRSGDAEQKKRVFQQAQRAMTVGDLDQAEMLVVQAMRSGSPHPGVRRLWVRSALRQGKVAAARMRAERAAKAQPNDAEFLVLAAQSMAAAGRPRRALKRLDIAISRWPNDFRPRLLKFNLLQRLGLTLPALKVLKRLRKHWADQPDVLLAAAEFYRNHGRLRAARGLLEHLRNHHPQHRQARVVRIDLANAATDGQEPSPLPDLLATVRDSTVLSSADAAELLQAVKFAKVSELASVCEEALELVGGRVDQLTEQDQLMLFRQAERLGHTEVAHRALAGILDNGPRRGPVALALFRKAMTSLGSQQADVVASRLLRYIPKAQQASVAADFALLVDGPHMALERLRRDKRQRRSPQEALQLARFLRLGNPQLGLRYLRFCRRQWPDEANLSLLHAKLLMDVGRPNAARRVLSTPIPAARHNEFTQTRAHSLLESGHLRATKLELDKARDYIPDNGIVAMRLRTLITLGRDDEARQLISEAQRRGMNNRITSGHFSTSLHGSLMSDLALYRHEQAALPPGEYDDYLAARYVHAASTVIERHSEHTTSPAYAGQRLIPRRVFQYWNESTPPETVMEIMQSWSSLPNVEYVRFDSQQARTFLRDTFGADYERAFRLANNTAEGADLLRLCYLRHYGGVYADADDRMCGKWNALIPAGVGLVCFQEPFNILANNVIAAVPGHPAIVRASEMAAEALLSRDNENTWSKTGPGLLTRAVASYLKTSKPSRPEEKVAIRPNYILRRQAQIHIQLPHKKTRGYWNAANTTGVDMTSFFTGDERG